MSKLIIIFNKILNKASGGTDKIIILWDVRDSKPFNAILAHSLTINSLDFSTNREYLISAGGDGYWYFF